MKITIERETLERAAKVLAYCHGEIENMDDAEDTMICHSVAELRAALAQSGTDVQQAEPVAWLRFQEHADRPTTVHLCDSDHPRAFQVYAAPQAQQAEPVVAGPDDMAVYDAIAANYAAPPAPAPLTDEWIAAFSMQINGLSYAQVESLVQHVERAHGIGDKP